MATHYFTACSLDGFIATGDHSLDWLFRQRIDPDGPMAYQVFERSVGALAMGASTYEWILRHEGQTWPYTEPTWVFTHRNLPVPVDADVRLTRADVATVHAEMMDAAAGAELWLVGGGELVGQFADAGLLDEVWVQYAPVTLGSGRPLLPRVLDLELIEVARNQDFLCGHFRVLHG